jgi:hypothetical protein
MGSHAASASGAAVAAGEDGGAKPAMMHAPSPMPYGLSQQGPGGLHALQHAHSGSSGLGSVPRQVLQYQPGMHAQSPFPFFAGASTGHNGSTGFAFPEPTPTGPADTGFAPSRHRRHAGGAAATATAGPADAALRTAERERSAAAEHALIKSGTGSTDGGVMNSPDVAGDGGDASAASSL